MAKIQLDEEVKRELMGLAPFSPDVNYKYIPAYYQGKKENGEHYIKPEFWPTFSIRCLTKFEKDVVRKELYQITNDKKTPDYSMINETVRKKITGWENLIDIAKMETIDYTQGKDMYCDEILFNQLPDIIKSSLWTQLLAISGLLNTERLGLGY